MLLMFFHLSLSVNVKGCLSLVGAEILLTLESAKSSSTKMSQSVDE